MHQRGFKHQNADELSRRPCKQFQCPESEYDTGGGDIVNDVVDDVVPLVLPMQTCMATSLQSSESVREVQLGDPLIGLILRAKEYNRQQTTPENFITT